MAATIDTSWHPVAVPDLGGSAFLSYSAGLRESAEKALANVVSQRQKDIELQNAKEVAQLELDLKDAALQEQKRQADLTNALGEKKLAADILNNQLTYDLGLKKLAAIREKAAAASKSGGGNGLSGIAPVLQAIKAMHALGTKELPKGVNISEGLTDDNKSVWGALEAGSARSNDPDLQRFNQNRQFIRYLPDEVQKEIQSRINGIDWGVLPSFDSTKQRRVAKLVNSIVENNLIEAKNNMAKSQQNAAVSSQMDAVSSMLLNYLFGGGGNTGGGGTAAAPSTPGYSNTEQDFLLGTTSNNSFLGDDLI